MPMNPAAPAEVYGPGERGSLIHHGDAARVAAVGDRQSAWEMMTIAEQVDSGNVQRTPLLLFWALHSSSKRNQDPGRASPMKRRLLVFALGIFLLAPAALAGEAYVGASVGQTEIEFSDEGDAPGTVINFDEGDNSFKVYGGFRFVKFFGVEGSYVDMGSPDEDLDAPVGTNLKVSVIAWDAYAVGILPIGEVFEVFGKAGFIWWDADIDVSGTVSASDSDSGSDGAYGVGVAFRLGKLVAIRGEYEQFEIEDTENVHLTSVGIDFRF